MARIFRIFLGFYMFYMHIGGFLQFRFDLKTVSFQPSRGWRIYSLIYAAVFIIAQIGLYLGMFYLFKDVIDFQSLRIITTAVCYCSVLIMTTAIVIHQVVAYQRFFSVTDRVFRVIHQVRKFNLDGCLEAQQLRTRLSWTFFVKAINFEALSLLIFTDRDDSGGVAADLGVLSNLWLINIVTTVYVSVFLVLIYHFTILKVRVADITEELRCSQAHRRTTAVDLSFRHCDDIDEIAELHRGLRTLARLVQRLFQPLLLLTFAYHWFNFIIMAYLWYSTYTDQGAFRMVTLVHYVSAMVSDLVDVMFVCAVVHRTTNVAAETGLMLQKFNVFEMDQRLERTVSE